jgi:urease accessory protein
MNRKRALLAVAAVLAPVLALAHPGHDTSNGFVAGIQHPLTGSDHLAAMLAAGFALGWLVIVRRPLLRVVAAPIAVVCLFHGFAHVVELPREIWQPAFIGGFVFSTLLLLAMGAVFARMLARRVLGTHVA